MLRSLIAILFVLTTPLAMAAGQWSTHWDHGDLMAIAPDHHLSLRLSHKSDQAVWGYLTVPITADQLASLNKYRTDPLFPFIRVTVAVDDDNRTAQAKIDQDSMVVQAELDVQHWEELKKGRHLQIRFPDGSHVDESLQGSGNAIRALERQSR